jgi:hypothetical protein
MSGARVNRGDVSAGNLPQQVASAQSDRLRLEVARHVVGDFARRRFEVAIEGTGAPQRVEQFAGVDDGGGQFARLGRANQGRILAAQVSEQVGLIAAIL